MTNEHDSIPDVATAIDAVQARLFQMRQLWEKAADNYFIPQEFRLYLQSCITVSRTVTFILQSNKSLFSGFDNWYQKYQNNWRNDKIMIWAKDARNVIEKQSDLSIFSQARAEIIASYLDGPQVDWNSSILFRTNGAIFASIPKIY